MLPENKINICLVYEAETNRLEVYHPMRLVLLVLLIFFYIHQELICLYTGCSV